VRRAGGDPAAFPQEWDGVIALAGRIRALGADFNGIAYDVHGWPDRWLFEAMITQAGGRLLNEAGDAIAFDRPSGLNALRTFRRFVTEGGMTPIDWDQSRQQFVTGPEAQKVVVEMTGYLPTNRRAAGPEFLGPWYEANPNARTPILQADRAGPWGAYPGGNSVRSWRAQRDVITLVMRGELTPEAGLERISSETTRMMRG
jgi:ABC-type glycerol-3-phosphate transport system substrate-binding protein